MNLQRSSLRFLTGFGLALSLPFGAYAETLRAGDGQSYATPCQAIAAANEGDVIEIYAGANYAGDVCSWSKNGLTLRGVEGRPHISAGDQTASEQGIWVIDGDNTVIENIELSGAFGSDGRGAAIRLNGHNLTVRGSILHHNETGLSVADVDGENSVLIEHSEFHSNLSDNISVGKIARLTVGFSYSHSSAGGHLIHSQAAETNLYYNRFTAEDGSTAAEISLPFGGRATLVGNVIQKGPNSQTGALVSYMEGEADRHELNALRAVSNTFVSEYGEDALFVDVAPESQSSIMLQNNIFFGRGQITNYAEAVLNSNLNEIDPVFVNPAEYDYRLHDVSPAIDAGNAVDEADSALTAAYSYARPGCVVPRDADQRIDVGAFEFGAHDSCDEPVIESTGIRKAGASRAVAVVSSLSLSPSTLSGGATTTNNYVTLSEPAPPGGAYVTLRSSHSSVVPFPSTVVVLAGTRSQRFIIRTAQTSSPISATVTASYAGASRSAVLSVTSVTLSSIALSPASFGGGLTTHANRVVLTGPAPAGGAVVYLSSSNASIARPPSSITVAAGVTTAYFNLASSGVSSNQSAQITASFRGASKTTAATVTPVGLLSVTTTPTSIVSGSPSCIIKVKLNGPAPSGGASVSLKSSATGAASIPSTLTVPAGATEVFSQVKVGWVAGNTSVALSGTYKGITRTANLTVMPTAVYALTLSPSATSGGTTTTSNLVRLNGPAPAGGAVVSLSSSNGSAASVPSTVTVPAGRNYVNFTIRTSRVGSSTNVSILGAYRATRSATLTVR